MGCWKDGGEYVGHRWAGRRRSYRILRRARAKAKALVRQSVWRNKRTMAFSWRHRKTLGKH